jgi:hypothetical protein
MVNFTFRKLCVAAMIASFVFASAETATAQRRGRGGVRQGHISPVYLLQLPDVQVELKLSDDQKAKAAAAIEKLATGRSEIIANVAKESGQRGAKIKELSDQAAAAVDAILDESQKQRLREVVIQVNGANELENEEVQLALQFTEAQKTQLKDVVRANNKTRRETMADFVGDRWEKSQELQEEANRKLLEVLTPEQKKQFEAMQGVRIEIDLYQT